MAIINDNDMEIILKGAQELDVIRKMLDNRMFCLIKMPSEKPKEIISDFSSSVFVDHMNGMFRSFAIRNDGLKTLYSDCEYYLSIYYRRGTDDERETYFVRSLEYIKPYCLSITYPTLKELISFLRGKELVLITNWMGYGNMENLKVNDFLKDILFVWEECGSKFIRKDESCDVRVFVTHIDDNSDTTNNLCLEDVRNFDIRQRIVDQFTEKSKKYYNKKDYYCAEFETQTKDVQAAYFLTRFHSNTLWEADPVNIVNVRISMFVLPGVISTRKAKKIPLKKKTRNIVSGTEYMIDSIHCNSDIFFDIDEFKKYISFYLEEFKLD